MQILGLHPRATESKWWDGDSPIHGFMRLSVDPTAHSFWEPLDQRALVSRCHSGEKSAWKWRRHKRRELDAWVGKISWSRKWLSTPVFLPGKFPRTEEPGGLWSRVSTHTHTHTHRSERNKTGGRGTMQEIGSITYIRLHKKLQCELEGVISEAWPTAMFAQGKQVSC